MERNTHFLGIFHTLRHILSHIGVTLLAVGIAFSLPVLAKFICSPGGRWWKAIRNCC